MSTRNYSLGKGARNNVSERAEKAASTIIHLGSVIESDDQEAGAGRIKVRVKGLDDKKVDNEIPYCWPFLPLYLNIQPRVGETVKVFLYKTDNESSYREYIGPLIPQVGEKLLGARNFDEAKAGREGSLFPFLKSVFKIPTAKQDLYPNYDEIALQGRDNADLVFKPSEVLIRAAKFLPNQPNTKNEKNPAYIQIKTLNPGTYENDERIESEENPKFKIQLNDEKIAKTRTDIKMVSNKIYLVGRDSESSIVKPFLTDEEQSKIEQNLHPIVYGDILKDFINKVYDWIQNHTHTYHNVPQNPANSSFLNLQWWKTNELPKLLSKNIFAGGDVPVLSTDILTNAETPERENSELTRVDDQEESPIKIESSKVCDDNTCNVEFSIVNKIDNEEIIKIVGTGNNEINAYINATQQLFSQLDQFEVDYQQLIGLLPQFADIPEF